MFSPTNTLILRRGSVAKPKEKCLKRKRTSSGEPQTEAGITEPIPDPFERPSVQDPIAHQKSEELYVQSTIFQSNSWPERNGSITRRNQFLSRRRTKHWQSTVVRKTTASSGYSTLGGASEAGHGNELNSGDKEVGLGPNVLCIKDAVDPQ